MLLTDLPNSAMNIEPTTSQQSASSDGTLNDPSSDLDASYGVLPDLKKGIDGLPAPGIVQPGYTIPPPTKTTAGRPAKVWIPKARSNRTIVLCFDGTGDQFDSDVRPSVPIPECVYSSFSELERRPIGVDATQGRYHATAGILPTWYRDLHRHRFACHIVG